MNNKDLYETIYSKKQVAERWLRVEINTEKEMLNGMKVVIDWVPTAILIVNMTKHRII